MIGWRENGDNTFTAIANDSLGRSSTASVTYYLPGTNNFTYDLNGNLLSDGYRTFTYDDENELTSIIVSNGVTTPTLTSNIYDGKMRLRIRREYTWSSGWQWAAEVHYIYDGNLVIQERDINNLPTVSYTRGNDLSGSLQGAGGIGGLLARTDFGLWTLGSGLAHAYYHADGNGNVTMLINSTQGIAAKYEYDPYGNVLSLSGSLAAANAYRFSSKEYFQNSGLYCYGRRFYDPNLQRWLNRDPIGEMGGINLYTFIDNQPVNLIDLLGLQDATQIGIGMGIIGIQMASASGALPASETPGPSAGAGIPSGGGLLGEEANEAADHLADAAEQGIPMALEQRANEPLVPYNPARGEGVLPGSGALGATGAVAGALTDAALGFAQAGPGVTTIAAVQAVCDACLDCTKTTGCMDNSDVPAERKAVQDCKGICDKCEKLKAQVPSNGVN